MSTKTALDGEAKYQLLLQISQKVRDTLDLDDILNHLLDAVATVLDYNAAGVFVLNREIVHERRARPRNLIAGIARRGFPPSPEDRDRMLAFGEGITGHVIRTGEVVVAPDVRLDSRYVVGRPETLSEIAVPILSGEHPFGALNLESDRLAAFDEGDLEVLRFFADAAAISIQKSMLHRRLLEKQRLDEQLRTASEVQARLLPSAPPILPGYDLAGLCLPNYEIGGDYFDFIPLGDGRLGLALADVSGEGVPAALVMAGFRALLRTHARGRSDLARVAQTINRLLPDFSGRSDFVTAVYAELEPGDGAVSYVNCGHHPMLILHSDGRLERCKQGGPALSVLDDAEYLSGRARLEPGALLLMYTDGVVEVENPDGHPFGVDRLLDTVRSSAELPAEATVRAVVRDVQAFAGLETFDDDFTLLVLKRKRMQ